MEPRPAVRDRGTLRLALLAMAFETWFVLVLVVLHLLRRDLPPGRTMISQYAVGPYGALMASAFVALALALLMLVLGLLRDGPSSCGASTTSSRSKFSTWGKTRHGPHEAYAQAAGGDGAFTAEWYEVENGTPLHWVGGLSDVPPDGEIAIPTRDARVTVRRNERLASTDVKEILGAFVQGSPRPSRFAWRRR